MPILSFALRSLLGPAILLVRVCTFSYLPERFPPYCQAALKKNSPSIRASFIRSTSRFSRNLPKFTEWPLSLPFLSVPATFHDIRYRR